MAVVENRAHLDTLAMFYHTTEQPIEKASESNSADCHITAGDVSQ